MIQIQNFVANGGRRLSAYLIDIIPLSIVSFGISYFFFGFKETLHNYINRGDDIAPRLEYLIERNRIRNITFFAWLVYCIILEASSRQATLGKIAMGIKVVDASGSRISLSRSILRNLSKILSFIPFGLGFLWILFDKRKQGWHDKLNKTFIVDTYLMARFEAMPSIPVTPLPNSDN